MRAIVAGAILFGVAIFGLVYVNSTSSERTWVAAAVSYGLALVLVQFLQPLSNFRTRTSVRFNVVAAAVVTILIFVDTLLVHRGAFKDVERNVSGLLYRAIVIVVGLGLPTAAIGCLSGMGVTRVLRSWKSPN